MCKDRSNANLCEATAQKAQQQQHYHLQEQQLAVARRCGCGIFPPMSVVPAGDADDSSSPTPASATAGAEDEPEEWPLVGGSSTSCHGDELRHAERRLPSGDFYAGTWCGNVPHGAGKYLWADGCMYQGEWHRGRATGRGRFSWPSGATYEGDLVSGFMHGVGTYTGSSGDTYRGSRCMNLNHGRGKKCYSNGDFYDGEWRRGVQEGQGRYVWSSGNEYAGSWKAGAIHGKGVLTWANGDCYDGSWEGGAPSGVGRFRWGDGSCYHGVWRKGTCVEEGVSIVPSQNVWGTEAGFLQKEKAWRLAKFVYPGSRTWPLWRASVGGRRPKMGSNSSSCSNLSEDGVCGEFEELCRGVPEGSEGKGGGSQLVNWVHRGVKKQGEAIAMGHKSYELMLSLQLGIRHSVEKTAPVTTVDLKASAFDPKEKVWTRFPPEGTKQTPPHQSREFKWKDYCPVVFRTLRKLFKIDAADYMISLCGNDALRELSSPGKSGSFFFLTHDDRYMIKTIRKSEVKVLLRMLPAYYNHVRAFESTLVTKFFGLHCVKFPGPIQRKVRFIIMGNLFCSEYTVHRRFDLKGSSHGRITDKPEVEIDETTTLKDLDLNFIFWLESSWFQEFQRQVDRDCEFLEQERVMDYSLLVGLHFREMSMPRYPLVDKDINNLSSAREAAIPLPGADMDKFLYNLPRYNKRIHNMFLFMFDDPQLPPMLIDSVHCSC